MMKIPTFICPVVYMSSSFERVFEALVFNIKVSGPIISEALYEIFPKPPLKQRPSRESSIHFGLSASLEKRLAWTCSL